MISKEKFILICLIALFSFSLCFAQELETNYPEVGGYQPTDVSTPIPEYVKYIFNFSIWIAGFVAFGVLIIGGVKYIGSAGNPSIQTDSKNQIFSALGGIIILISSYLILSTINPQLIVLNIDPLEKVPSGLGPGIWLCKESIDGFEEDMEEYDNITEEQKKIIRDSCLKIFTKTSFPGIISNKLKHIYVVGNYGAVIHEGADFSKECTIVTSSQKIDYCYSITPFIRDNSIIGEGGVTLYKERDFEGDEKSDVIIETEEGESVDVDLKPVQSIEIDEDREWVAIVFGKDEFLGKDKYCEVFDESDRDLQGDEISKFCSENWFWRQPCAGKVFVFKGKTF